jgi:hypothetical protein
MSSGAVDSAASLFDSNRARPVSRPPSRGLGTSRIPSAAGASTRRPQAAVTPAEGNGAPTRDPITGRLIVPSPAVSRAPTPPPLVPEPALRRDDLDFEIETDIRSDWKGKDPIPVDDEQLVDWSANEETVSGSSADRTKR